MSAHLGAGALSRHIGRLFCLPHQHRLNFKATGENLTGTMSGRNGDIPIADGKISGDDISFSVTQDFGGNSVKQTFTGKASGGEIKFKREGGQGEPIQFVAKKGS